MLENIVGLEKNLNKYADHVLVVQHGKDEDDDGHEANLTTDGNHLLSGYLTYKVVGQLTTGLSNYPTSGTLLPQCLSAPQVKEVFYFCIFVDKRFLVSNYLVKF